MKTLLFSLTFLTLAGCWSQPQIGDSEDAFNEIDALYTAVTSKKPDLLNDCRKRLAVLNDDEKISPTAYKSVTSIIEEAEKGDWLPAAQRLHKFMRAQRRESDR